MIIHNRWLSAVEAAGTARTIFFANRAGVFFALFIIYSRIRLIAVWNKDAMRENVLQHQQILSAVQDRNPSYAKEFMKSHLHQLEGQVQRIMSEYPDYFVTESLPTAERFEALLSGAAK